MQLTIFNTNKHRLETVDAEFTDENTTWIEGSADPDVYPDLIYQITDFDGGILIQQNKFFHPIWIDEVTRVDIDENNQKAEAFIKELIDQQEIYY